MIVSNFPDMGDLVKKYGVGMIVENSAETLIKAVENIDSLSFKKENFSYSNLFELSWDRQAEKIKSVYEKLLV